MGNCNIKHAFATILFTFFYLMFLSCNFILFVVGDSLAAYEPTDNIVLDCGSSDNTTKYGDSRNWVGDVNSKFFPLDFYQNNASITAETQFSQVTDALYGTARLSHSEFTYFFPVSPGQKFVRLYFYSAHYLNFDRSKATFSVKAGIYTLLHNFNASMNADASHSDEIFREFIVYVEGNDKRLNITFTPTNPDSYAFVSAIEIVSMPMNLYYTQPDPFDQGSRGLRFVGHSNKFFPIENYTSLEVVYRINIGGMPISPEGDTGMFRTWSQESTLLTGYLEDARPFNLSIHLNYSKIHSYTAPEVVYRTARTMGPNRTLNKSYNLTWAYSIDPGFFFMLRLHFCEFEPAINELSDRDFSIYIGDMIAERHADVIAWAGGKGIPCYQDYVVHVPSSDGEMKRVNLSVKLQANSDSMTRFTNVILNGIEIFKLNDSEGNLGGKNPNSSPTQSLSRLISQSTNSNRKIVAIIMPIVVTIVVIMLALSLFIFCRKKTFTEQVCSNGTSNWATYSISRNKNRSTILPSALCRYFSLMEMRAATKDFDDALIIGMGGFGNVYKGYISDGTTQVAIKRLKRDSKQGENEFKTEIEMLSHLRHLHLVSLIGYCNEDNEMILVYDYMSNGTLRSHLICTGDNEQQPLTWKQRLQICIETARGLHYLHTGTKHTIIHRDVKSTNILLDEKWMAKVSDFGLSKFGPTSMSNAHVSTVVKGSFGYLDPEYCRRQQLTEKSDVYSFGVVLCEVLCARPALIHTKEEISILLAELVRRCYREKTIDQIIDPNIRNQITPECFKSFIKIIMSCIQSQGNQRPSMSDLVRGLGFVLQLQHNSKKEGYEFSGINNEEGWLLREATSGNSTEITTSSSHDSSVVYEGISGIVFSELKDLQGR